MNLNNTAPTIASFITSHGFGHAARTSAVLLALRQRIPEIQFELFTETPAWFFRQTLGDSFNHHPVFNDVGIVQSSPLDENLSATITRLEQLIPFNPHQLQALADQVTSLRCQFILCDISALGLAVSNLAKIPSVLQENFTWDWIYDGYLSVEPRFKPFAQSLASIYASSSYHIQTQPLCSPSEKADLIVNPISRPPKNSRQKTRQNLKIPTNAPAILVTMGGIPPNINFLPELRKHKDIYFIIPGASETYTCQDNLILFPHHSIHYHPDLINAADAVIGKAGYSTIAEAYYAGVPFAFISRANFREAPTLTQFILDMMPGYEIPEKELPALDWTQRIPELMITPKNNHNQTNGADQVADFLVQKFLIESLIDYNI